MKRTLLSPVNAGNFGNSAYIFFLKARYSNIDVFLLFQNSKNALTWVHEDIFEAFVRSFWRKKIVSKVAEKVCNALLRKKNLTKHAPMIRLLYIVHKSVVKKIICNFLLRIYPHCFFVDRTYSLFINFYTKKSLIFQQKNI